jgi:hypothetical protein
MALFIQILGLPTSPTADVGLKTEVLRVLSMIAVTYPKEIFKFLDHLLPPLFGAMVSGLDQYVKTTVQEIEESEPVVDEDGEILGLESMIMAMFMVVTRLVENPKNKPLRKAIGVQLENVMFHVISYVGAALSLHPEFCSVRVSSIRVWLVHSHEALPTYGTLPSLAARPP